MRTVDAYFDRVTEAFHVTQHEKTGNLLLFMASDIWVNRFPPNLAFCFINLSPNAIVARKLSIAFHNGLSDK